MNKRQAYAMQHPLARADGDPRIMRQYRAERRHATGLLLMTILAVDR